MWRPGNRGSLRVGHKLIRAWETKEATAVVNCSVNVARALCAVIFFAAAVPARAEPTLKLGVLTDLSSFGADVTGKASLTAVQMAIDDFGGSVLGKKIELVSGDTQNRPDIAANLAREFLDQKHVDVLLDLPQSAVSLTVQKIAQEHHVIDIVTSGVTAELTGKSCSPYGVHWAEDTNALAAGTGSRGCVYLGFDAVTHPSCITNPGELGVLPMALDLLVNAIERQITALEKSALEERLQQTRRMETVGALASGIAHNFNNIIAAILGYVEMAEAQVARGSRHERHLAEIRRAGERGRDVVEHLLRFGRRRGGRHRPLNVRDLMTETESLLRASLPASIELVFRPVPAGAAVVAEPEQLQQVILNLCSNAAQAMQGQGSVEVETTLRDLAEPRELTHGALKPDRYVVVAVTDAGPGIDDTVLGNLFDPFFTTRATGNGLGLATVREIVREHSGAINVISQQGEGSRFEVWLPCETTGRVAVNGHGEAAFGRGQTILLLSGGREQLLHDEEILAALGYEPVGFLSGKDAVAACDATPQRFDAILIACSLCPANMRRLPALLHATVPKLPILVASDPAEAFDLDALVSAGVSEVVTRPMIADEVAVALARCLQTAAARVATATLAPEGRGVANGRASGAFSRPVEKRDERVPARLGERSLEEIQTSARRRSR